MFTNHILKHHQLTYLSAIFLPLLAFWWNLVFGIASYVPGCFSHCYLVSPHNQGRPPVLAYARTYSVTSIP